MSSLILVVDDDRTMRSLLNLAMEEEGYRVLEAANGEQCLAEFTHFQPDLILLDAVMPDIDGFVCCQKIRSLPGGDRPPILLITVLDDQKSIEQAFAAGATDYITKPICWSILSYRVRRLLDGNQTWAKLISLETQLHQHQTWEQLIREIVARCGDGDRSVNLQEMLALIRQGVNATRVLLYRLDRQTYLESVIIGCPSIQDLSWQEGNLVTPYGEQYQQGKPIVIENVSQANLSPTAIAQLTELNSKSVGIIAIKQGEEILARLEIHFSEIFPHEGLSANRLLDLANLLKITINLTTDH